MIKKVVLISSRTRTSIYVHIKKEKIYVEKKKINKKPSVRL